MTDSILYLYRNTLITYYLWIMFCNWSLSEYLSQKCNTSTKSVAISDCIMDTHNKKTTGRRIVSQNKHNVMSQPPNFSNSLRLKCPTYWQTSNTHNVLVRQSPLFYIVYIYNLYGYVEVVTDIIFI